MIASNPRILAESLLDLALPPACPGCGAEGEVLCPACTRALRSRLDLPAGVPFGLPGPAPLPMVGLEWCAQFSGPVRAALHQLKYGGEKRLAGPLGAAMASRWLAAGGSGDLFVPVPVHASRARVRGYDQAVLLAMSASQAAGLPWLAALRRSRSTTPQFELGRRARLRNVTGAFEIAGPASAAAVLGRWIVLVDDVVTTGSTLVACADALHSAGAAVVSGLTVARER
jgi:ComF family protein